MLNILSWNILADEYVEKKYYKMVQDKLMDRKLRIKIICKKIKETKYDIICLQEVMIKEYNILIKKFSKKYNISRLTHIKWQHIEGESGNLIMIRLKKFNNIKFFSQKSIENILYSKIYYNDTKIIIVDDISKNKRENNVINIIKKIEKYKNVIICGDFNINYHHKGIYKLLEDNNFITSIHHHSNNFTYFIEREKLLDNILFKGDFTLNKASIDNMCSCRTVKHINCMFKKVGSDHFPVMVQLLL